MTDAPNMEGLATIPRTQSQLQLSACGAAAGRSISWR